MKTEKNTSDIKFEDIKKMQEDFNNNLPKFFDPSELIEKIKKMRNTKWKATYRHSDGWKLNIKHDGDK